MSEDRVSAGNMILERRETEEGTKFTIINSASNNSINFDQTSISGGPAALTFEFSGCYFKNERGEVLQLAVPDEAVKDIEAFIRNPNIITNGSEASLSEVEDQISKYEHMVTTLFSYSECDNIRVHDRRPIVK